MEALFVYVIVVNVVAFFLYGADKWNAKHDYRRIPERTLLGIAIVGGSVGSYIGMRLFRHKTRKSKFYIGIPIIFAIQIGTLIYISY